MYLERIGILRQQCSLTEKEAAKKIGISSSKYITYETGKKDIPIEDLLKIANVYNVSLDWLVGNDARVNMGIAYVVDYILFSLGTDKCFVNLPEMKLYLDVVCSDYHMEHFHIRSLPVAIEDYIYFIDLRNFCVKNMSDGFVGKKQGQLYTYGLDYAFSNGWKAFEIRRTDWYDARTCTLINYITKESINCGKLQQRELADWLVKNNTAKSPAKQKLVKARV